MTSPRVLLVRHGPTAWNRSRRFQGWSDEPLDRRAREQARRLRYALRHLGRPDRLWSSDLARAVETAMEVFPDRSAILDPRLRELSFGTFEGRTRRELERHPAFVAWCADPDRHPPPGGERLADLRERVAAWWRDRPERGIPRARRPAGHPAHLDAVVTHGGVIGLLLEMLLGEAAPPLPRPLHAILLLGAGTSWSLLERFGPGEAPREAPLG